MSAANLINDLLSGKAPMKDSDDVEISWDMCLANLHKAAICFRPYIKYLGRTGSRTVKVRGKTSRKYFTISSYREEEDANYINCRLSQSERMDSPNRIVATIIDNWDKFCNPDGYRIAECIQDITRVGLILSFKNPRSSLNIVKVYRHMFLSLGAKNFPKGDDMSKIANDIYSRGTKANEDLVDIQAKRNISVWPESVRNAATKGLQNAQDKLVEMCCAQFGQKGFYDFYTKNAKRLKGVLATDDLLGRPWPYFDPDSYPDIESLHTVDTKALRIYQSFKTFGATLNSENMTRFKQLLSKPGQQKAVKVFGQLSFLTADREDFLDCGNKVFADRLKSSAAYNLSDRATTK